jgi:hypothetical protein
MNRRLDVRVEQSSELGPSMIPHRTHPRTIADGTRLPDYRVDRCCYPGVSFIVGKICAVDCAFEVRFGTKNGERRAYLTVDTWPRQPRHARRCRGSGWRLGRGSHECLRAFTLSGVVTEATAAGTVPVEGVSV